MEGRSQGEPGVPGAIPLIPGSLGAACTPLRIAAVLGSSASPIPKAGLRLNSPKAPDPSAVLPLDALLAFACFHLNSCGSLQPKGRGALRWA